MQKRVFFTPERTILTEKDVSEGKGSPNTKRGASGTGNGYYLTASKRRERRLCRRGWRLFLTQGASDTDGDTDTKQGDSEPTTAPHLALMTVSQSRTERQCLYYFARSLLP